MTPSNGITNEDIARFQHLAGGGEDQPVPLASIVTVKVTGNTIGELTLGAGKWTGKMAQALIPPDPANTTWLTTDLDADHLGFDADDDCYILDYGQSLAADAIVTGHVIDVAPDGRYIVVAGSGSVASSHWFRIASSSQDGTNKRWTYTCKLQAKTATGYGGWADSSDDTADYTLYNSIENANAATGTYGNGVASSNLTGTFAVKPLGANARVKAWPVTFTVDGTPYTEWWFSAVNQVDGACP
jgi:hypothetical protein